MGACWHHVRHVPQGGNWHPATDQMRGTEAYGSESGNAAWSITFADINYDQVLWQGGWCYH